MPAGRLLGVAAADPAEAIALADRLGPLRRQRRHLGRRPAGRASPLDEVRERILVADHDSYLFAGHAAGHAADPERDAATREMPAALHAASAEDVVDALPDGLDTPVDTRARTLSGGQRQRVRLARALLAEPEVLILIDPTSAVDAHTEARIAERLREARAGRTTVVLTTSPLLLGHADAVAFLRDGRIVATGTHADLLEHRPGYRALVSRRDDAISPSSGQRRVGRVDPERRDDRAPGRRPGHGPPHRAGPASPATDARSSSCWCCTARPRSPGSPRRGCSAASSTRSPPGRAPRPSTGWPSPSRPACWRRACCTRYAHYAGHRFGERAVARLREEFVSRTLDLPVSVVERAGTGDLATRSSVDVATVGTTVRDVVPILRDRVGPAVAAVRRGVPAAPAARPGRADRPADDLRRVAAGTCAGPARRTSPRARPPPS